MKNLKLAILVLLVATGVASANLLPENDVRLHMHITALRSGRVTVVEVFGNGNVYGQRGTPGQPILVETLPPEKMALINDLIDRANHEDLVLPDPHVIHCMMMSISSESFTADNGSVKLFAGPMPCGPNTRRVGAATEQLIDILNAEDAKLNRHLN